MKEAILYEKLEDERVRCHLCAHRCTIAAGHKGVCGVRENQGGALYTLVYGRAISLAVDPVEKKPLFHFHPGSTALSVATVGCNLRCLFCQNADISQWPRERRGVTGDTVPPETVVREGAIWAIRGPTGRRFRGRRGRFSWRRRHMPSTPGRNSR